jgi:hypothetical protein
LNGSNRGRHGKRKEKKEEEEKELVRRRGGWKMLRFYHSRYFTVCTSELFTKQTPFRPTQKKIPQNAREVTAYLNYLFVSSALDTNKCTEVIYYSNIVSIIHIKHVKSFIQLSLLHVSTHHVSSSGSIRRSWLKSLIGNLKIFILLKSLKQYFM